MCEQHWVHSVNFHSWQIEKKTLEYTESFSSISEGCDPFFPHTFPLDFSILLYLYVLPAAHILADAQAKKEVVTHTLTYFVYFERFFLARRKEYSRWYFYC